jgi:hypothetical protein
MRYHLRQYVTGSSYLVQIEQTVEHLSLKLKGQDISKEREKGENGYNTPA